MILYISLLVSKLFYCESLTSMELFDVFDLNADLELEPVIENTGGSFIFHHNTVDEHSTATAENYSNATVENYSNATVENYSNATVENYSNATVENYSSKLFGNYNNSTENYSTVTVDNYNKATVENYSSTLFENYSNATVENDSTPTVDNYSNATVENYSSVTVDNYSNATVDNYSSDTNRNHSPEDACLGNIICAEKSNNTEKNYKDNITEALVTPRSTTNTDTKHYIKWIYNTNEPYNNSGKDIHKLEIKNEFAGKVTLSENRNPFAKTPNKSKLELSNGISYYDTYIVSNKSRTLPPFSIPQQSCTEEEVPANIGAYEVPSQWDVALHVRNHLRAMYQAFHSKAMHFLRDVKQATQASWSRKMFCRSATDLMHYRRCVRWVGEMSVLTTKSLVTAFETARPNINTFMQGKICNISTLNVDPIHLIRILTAEKVSLEFALPDFLRQLNACARHCPSTRLTLPREYLETTHLTDRDYVIRHYLTQQNYNQQLRQHYKI